jgi:hypothetical protein
MSRKITDKQLMPKLCEAIGVNIDDVQRIVIDCDYASVVRVYVQKVGRDTLLDFDWKSLVNGEDVKIISKPDGDDGN